MKRNITTGFLSLTLIFSYLHQGLQAQNIYSEYIDGQIYFQLKEQTSIPEIYSLNSNKIIAEIPIINALKDTFALRSVSSPFYFSNSPKLKRTFMIEFVEANEVDHILRFLKSQEEVEFAEKSAIRNFFYTPNDPAFGDGNQAYLDQINARAAWEISKGSKTIVVAVTDMGTDISHPDLKENLWINTDEIAGNGIDDDGNGMVDDINGWNTGNNNNNVRPNNPNVFGNNHGTHVAGLVSAKSDNAQGLASIGFNLSIMPIKIITTSGNFIGGYPSVAYAAENGAHVINMSWGGPSFMQTEKNVIDYAYSKGSVLIAAAGNGGNTTPNYPAALSNVIAVAGLDQNDRLTSTSTRGSFIDVSAPGYEMLSLFDISVGGTGKLGGTSQSSPIVAGLCGLILSANPALSQEEVKNCLLNSVVDISSKNLSYQGMFGAGKIDAGAALACATNTSPSADAGIFQIITPGPSSTVDCSVPISPLIRIKNYGIKEITDIDIQYSIDNKTAQTFIWNGSLGAGRLKSVSLPEISIPNGNHTITVTTVSPNGLSDSNSDNDSKTNNFTASCNVGIDDNQKVNPIIIYPTVSNGIIHLESNDSRSGNFNFSIANMIGEEVYHDSFYLSTQTSINLTHLTKGTYLLILSSPKSSIIQVEKVMIR